MTKILMRSQKKQDNYHSGLHKCVSCVYYYLLLSFLFFCTHSSVVYAQEISQSTLSSGGGHFTTPQNIIVQFTVGQGYMTNTLASVDNVITQGLQQPNDNQSELNKDLLAIQDTKFEVYPNPATSLVNMELYLRSDFTLESQLVSISGQVVYTKQHKVLKGSHRLQIPLQDFPSGVYTVVLKVESVILTKKLIVNNQTGFLSKN